MDTLYLALRGNGHPFYLFFIAILGEDMYVVVLEDIFPLYGATYYYDDTLPVLVIYLLFYVVMLIAFLPL